MQDEGKGISAAFVGDQIQRVIELNQKKIDKLDVQLQEREKVFEAKLNKKIKEASDKNGKKIKKVEESVIGLASNLKGVKEMPSVLRELD